MAKREWPEMLWDDMGLPPALAPGSCGLTIEGWRRLTIAGHEGVAGYAPGRLTVRLSGGLLRIEGEGLEITAMDGEQLVIEGRVTGLWREEQAHGR